MTENPRRRATKTKAFLERLRELLGALPSESEKEEAQGQFDALIAFLSELKENLHRLPDLESTGDLREVVNRMEEAFARAERDPNLAAVLGLRPASRRKPPVVPSSPEQVAVARSAIAELQGQPVDSARSMLQDEARYSMSSLRTIATGLRIRSAAKLSRESLVHQIAMKLANLRGYEHLRSGGDSRDANANKESP